MMTEANAGFRAFHHGDRTQREADFIRLRRRLAEGARWGEDLIHEVAPWVPERPDGADGERSSETVAAAGTSGGKERGG
jgi:hypothetical protein